jgi:phosphopantothenoylcysteine decarboxylase / phosphopantothenate---cysteine ligase
MPASSDLQGKKIVLCVTGGIAAYKIADVARRLVSSGAEVHVAMTRSAQRFVGAETFSGITAQPVLTDLFDASGAAPHVELARGADVFVVAPATAHTIARLALGMADDIVAATALMVRCPALIVPAMHTEMWEHVATQEHVETLRARRVTIVGPATGPLMSGDFGAGRMVEPDEIVAAVSQALGHSQSLAGYRVVVTAGGTQEPIDPVRFIGNRSSGLMGFTIAAEAAARGAKVTLIAGPNQLRSPQGIDVVSVRTSDEMRDAVMAAAPDADVIVKAAAVADFKPARHSDVKLKKAEGPPDVNLEPTHDILAELGASPGMRKPGGILVGFAAETEPDPDKLAELARKKRESKKADVIVANDVLSPDSGFHVHTNRAVIVDAEGVTDLGLVTKIDLARSLVDRISVLLG